MHFHIFIYVTKIEVKVINNNIKIRIFGIIIYTVPKHFLQIYFLQIYNSSTFSTKIYLSYILNIISFIICTILCCLISFDIVFLLK
jgi:hypothetical protein